MSAIVLDASVAVKLLSEEPDSDLAAARVASASLIVAPDIIMIEVAHALWKKDHTTPNAATDAQAAVAALAQMIDRLVPADALLPAALTLAHQLPHALYDCLYLAFGRADEVRVLTSDYKFATSVERAGLGHEIERLGAG